MDINIFVFECESRNIDPGIALENQAVQAALANNDIEQLKEALDTQF